ncbi:MAG: antitoxin [Lachnospiraceae bacterium]|nr:antitoxin [Lachnospiraceae bacterium]MCI9149655.1 antitoxin [Lachnospiraceae bacterium]
MEEKYLKRFESFQRSLDALAEARERDMTDSFVLSGTSAKFSITFELAWKVMKDILTGYYDMTDFVSGSPKEVLKRAFSAELISDDQWLMMLCVRNELAYDYDSEIIKERCQDITESYIDLFYEFSGRVNQLYEEAQR